MLRIYDEVQLTRRLRLRRIEIVALFAGGLACGSWLSSTSADLDLLPSATAARAPVHAQPPQWCASQPARPKGLRMDCELTQPGLPRAAGI